MSAKLRITPPSGRTTVRALPTAGGGIVDTMVYHERDVAYLLHHVLGGLRAWSAFLEDCRKGRTHLHGYVLEPIAVIRDRGNQPVYAGSDIRAFISAILAIEGPGRKKRLQGVRLQIDLSKGVWRQRKFSTQGTPLARQGPHYAVTRTTALRSV